MRYLLALAIVGVGSGLFYVAQVEREVEVLTAQLSVPEAPLPAVIEEVPPEDLHKDIAPQKPLSNPPDSIRAIYYTSLSGASEKRITQLIDLTRDTEINAVVIDVKDYSGYLAYDTDLEEVQAYGAKRVVIPRLNRLLKRLHDEGIYVIARITVFQDPVLAKARPDLAVHDLSKFSSGLTPSTGSGQVAPTSTSGVTVLTPVAPQRLTTETVWEDRKGLSWIDPSAPEAWEYIVSISRDVANRGFDELNFDYIRFPSDGNTTNMVFPYWNGELRRHEVLTEFFSHLRKELDDVRISADLFGLTTVNRDDLGIGQVIEDTYDSFDYVAPMVYPSHYSNGFLGHPNPAQAPYEVVKYSMQHAFTRLANLTIARETELVTHSTSSGQAEEVISTSTITRVVFTPKAKLRPWLQDFDLGATYDAAMVRSEINAVYDALDAACPSDFDRCDEFVDGYMLWSPSNVYTRDALTRDTNDANTRE